MLIPISDLKILYNSLADKDKLSLKGQQILTSLLASKNPQSQVDITNPDEILYQKTWTMDDLIQCIQEELSDIPEALKGILPVCHNIHNIAQTAVKHKLDILGEKTESDWDAVREAVYQGFHMYECQNHCGRTEMIDILITHADGYFQKVYAILNSITHRVISEPLDDILKNLEKHHVPASILKLQIERHTYKQGKKKPVVNTYPLYYEKDVTKELLDSLHEPTRQHIYYYNPGYKPK